MQDWTPRRKDNLEASGLDLTPEEGFLLSRLDGATTMGELASLTGKTIPALATVVAQLVAQGAVHDDDMPGALRELLEPVADPDVDDPGVDDPGVDDPGVDDPGDAADADADDAGDDGHDAPALIGLPKDLSELGDLGEGVRAISESSRAAYQRIFTTKLKDLHIDQRVAAAERGGAEELCALCFDPSPRVIAAVLQNSATTAVHARMIARNHGARAGLDKLGSKPKLINDKLVQRALLRNRWCSDELCSKVLRGRSMNQLYLDHTNTDHSDKARRGAVRHLRKNFTSGSGDAKAVLIVKTEGRCLRVLGSLPLDERTVAILSRRTTLTTLLVQNLANWPPTPPTLLRFLAKHQMVKRNVALRNRLLKHPNCPSDAKRG